MITKVETIPFDKKEIAGCYNVWKDERYENPILNKAFPLYASYTRKGSSLVGNGELIGYVALFSGKAYRGMGALGCSFRRTKGVGILYADEKSKMRKELDILGLTTTKLSNMKFKNIKSDTYTLVFDKETKTYDNGNISICADDIKLIGENDSVDFIKEWSHCYTLDFK